jgi:hypothetical protein
MVMVGLIFAYLSVTLCERYMIYLIYHFLTEEKGADLMSNTANMVRLVAE